MWDARHGGFFWRVGDPGQVKSSEKWLYGQSFALYALVEYYRAGERPEVLADAIALFQLVQERMVDRRHGGWLELSPTFITLDSAVCSNQRTNTSLLGGLCR